ncbi:hypothetical protein PG996_010302 [Apiospora saccharicola]|uniref:Uncharacterized protein n=1 Tax=Apiospora saccharicola TaxID=335842 RepID=A0ABR1UN83_9PEZI
MALMVNANYHGPRAEARTALEPFAHLGPVRSEYLQVPWPRVFETSYFGIDDRKACSRNQHVNMYSITARRTDARAMAAFVDELLAFSRSNPAVPTTFVVHRFPTQAVRRVPDDASAYPHRDLKMHM